MQPPPPVRVRALTDLVRASRVAQLRERDISLSHVASWLLLHGEAAATATPQHTLCTLCDDALDCSAARRATARCRCMTATASIAARRWCLRHPSLPRATRCSERHRQARRRPRAPAALRRRRLCRCLPRSVRTTSTMPNLRSVHACGRRRCAASRRARDIGQTLIDMPA
jgi:hypothetical protein